MLKLLLLYTLFCWKCKRILESVWVVIIEEKIGCGEGKFNEFRGDLWLKKRL